MKFAPLLASRKEMSFGWRYLAFQAVFLSPLLYRAVTLLRLPLDSAGLNFLFFCLNFGVAAVCFRSFLGNTLRASGSRLPRILLTALGFFCLYQILIRLTALLIVTLDPGFANVNDAGISDLGRENFLLTAIGTVLLVPTAEEVLHRGVVFGSLYRRSRFAAYLVSTLLFAAIHVVNYIGYADTLTLALCYLQYLPAGICLAAAYEVSGSVLSPILIHTAVNAIGMAAMR